MKVIKDFRLSEVPLHKVLFVVTSSIGYGHEDRIIVVGNYPNISDDFTVIDGEHCSCFGFEMVTWEAVQYSEKEIERLVQGWSEHGDEAETKTAKLMLDYLKS